MMPSKIDSDMELPTTFHTRWYTEPGGLLPEGNQKEIAWCARMIRHDGQSVNPVRTLSAKFG